MNRHQGYALLSAILIVGILAQMWGPSSKLAPVTVAAQPTSSQAGISSTLANCYNLYLPTILKSTGSQMDVARVAANPLATGQLSGPDFEIISPAADGTIAGMTYFAVQPINNVSSVSFKAGETDLGTDMTPSDGFKVFLDTGSLPTGTLTLSATATNLCGSTQKSINVNVVADPPDSGTVGPNGGVFASEIGSIITFPPGSVPEGTSVSVLEKTQEQITAENGLDWDAMGVTFLGAQQITTSVPVSLPLGVSSAGFGNRVQPGQAVVNYRIAPDADGDGVDELIVFNTATVAPNNDVIADPIPKTFVIGAQTQSDQGILRYTLAEAISGPPGTLVQLEVSGFNPYSPFGNIARFRSSVDGSVVEIHGYILPDFDTPSTTDNQLFVTVIPPMIPGPATLILKNETTGYTTAPLDVDIGPVSNPQAPARETIDAYLNTLSQVFKNFDTPSFPFFGKEQLASAQENLDLEIANFTAVLDQLDESDPNVQELLNTFASMIEASNLLPAIQATPSSATLGIADYLLAIGLAAVFVGFVAIVFTNPIAGLAVAAFGLEAAATTEAVFFIGAILLHQGGFLAFLGYSILSSTGMGAAPPVGGDGGGFVVSDKPPGNFQNNLFALAAEPGDYIIKLFSNGLRRPFSGMTDPGGYFYVPLIPANELFTAVAIDTSNGDTRSYTGIGPPERESILFYFDFLHDGELSGSPIDIGQVITGEITNTSQLDIYSFSVSPGQTVFFDEQGAGGNLAWQVTDPLGNIIVNEQLSTSDPGLKVLERGGVYVVTVSSNGGTGTYQFQIWNVPPPDVFAINIGDVVSDGNPAPGAGNIETPGVRDVYIFMATAGQNVYFDRQASSGVTNIDWKLVDEDGTSIFDTCLGCSDPGVITLSKGGVYTMTAGEDRNSDTGAYQFQLWNVPPPDVFAINIGDVISPGVPGPGAGTIETPGVRDVYNFTAVAGQNVYFDRQAYSGVTNIDWQLVDEDGTIIFDTCLGCSDPGVITLNKGGVYTMTAGEDRNDSTGTYQFQLWNVPPPDVFAINIGDVISPGVPGPGAGTIETPGVRDVYNFTATAGQNVYFDRQISSGVTNIDWKLVDEDGTSIFDTCLGCSDPGVKTLSKGGVYTMTVGEDRNDSTGTYQFQVWNVPPPDVFAINIGDVISPGVPGPGAGTIETPGVRDIYNFSAAPGQQVYMDRQAYSGVPNIDWQLVDEDGTIIFVTCLACTEPGVKTLSKGGVYTLTIGEDNNESTGTYQFQVWNVPPPDVFAINIGDVISPGVPGPGAGTIETPGVRDVYNFTAAPGQSVYFDIQDQSGLGTINWHLADENGTIIFDMPLNQGDPGLKTLSVGGTYTITVGEDQNDATGTYQFTLVDQPIPDLAHDVFGDLPFEGVRRPRLGR